MAWTNRDEDTRTYSSLTPLYFPTDKRKEAFCTRSGNRWRAPPDSASCNPDIDLRMGLQACAALAALGLEEQRLAQGLKVVGIASGHLRSDLVCFVECRDPARAP